MSKNYSSFGSDTESPILILGCGLSGMITALSFAKHKIRTIIIEIKSVNDNDFYDDIRTTALTAASKNFFQHLGIWNKLLSFCGPINDIYVVDNRADRMLHFKDKSSGDDETMGYIIQNSVFKKSLYDIVSANKFITVLDNVKYQKIVNEHDNCEIYLDNGDSLKSNMLIVCDGRGSKAKQLFFSDALVEDYMQNAITFIVNHQKKHEGTAVEHFMHTGPFAILPLIDDHKSSIVWILPAKNSSVIIDLPLDEFTHLAQENFGEFLGEIEVISKIASFPLKAYTTRKYYNKNIVLLGDAAHVVHPLAGQGLNQGIKDIESLVLLVTKSGINKETFEEYQKDRETDNEEMLVLTSAINSIFCSKSKILHSARQIGFNVIEKIDPLKQFLINYAMGKRG